MISTMDAETSHGLELMDMRMRNLEKRIAALEPNSQQSITAIALLQRWIGAVDGNWQISEITDDTRKFLAQFRPTCGNDKGKG